MRLPSAASCGSRSARPSPRRKPKRVDAPRLLCLAGGARGLTREALGVRRIPPLFPENYFLTGGGVPGGAAAGPITGEGAPGGGLNPYLSRYGPNSGCVFPYSIQSFTNRSIAGPSPL